MSEANEPQVTSATAWKQNASAATLLECPSGNTCLVRKRPLASIWQAGFIPNSLLKIVRESLAKGNRNIQVDSDNMSSQQLIDVTKMVDKVVIAQVEEPVVSPVPVCKVCDAKSPAIDDCVDCLSTGMGERDEDKLYVDEIVFDDRSYIYMFVIGVVDDLEEFRIANAAGLESVSASKDVASKAKRPARNRG